MTHSTSAALLLLRSHTPNDPPPLTPESQRNVSMAAVRGAVRPSNAALLFFLSLFILSFIEVIVIITLTEIISQSG